MTAPSNSVVEIVSFKAYELHQVIDGNDMASEKRYLQVLIEAKDTEGRLVGLSAEQLRHLEWVDVKSGEVFPRCRCERVEIDSGDKRTDDNAPKQSLVTFLFEGSYEKEIKLEARLELDGKVNNTNEVALGAIERSLKTGARWLPGSTILSSSTVFSINLKKGINAYNWPDYPGYAWGNSPVSVFNLSLKSKKKILSVTTIPNGDSLFHVGGRVKAGVWGNCWWFHRFAAVRDFDFGFLVGDVGGDSITFSHMGAFNKSEVSPTGPEKFYFVTIDELSNRHETVLSVTNETYVFRDATPSESQYYSDLIARKGSA